VIKDEMVLEATTEHRHYLGILRPFEHYIALSTSCLHRLILDWLVALSTRPYMARYGTPVYDLG